MKYSAVVLALVALAAQGPARPSRQTKGSPSRPRATSERNETQGPSVEISFTSAARNEPVTGMVYLAISRDNRTPPIQQTSPTGVPLFSKYVDQLKPGVTVTLGP